MACIDPALAIPFDLSILTISHKKDHNAVKAVIVGGGIAGLSLAIMMARAGIEYIILERSTGLEPPIGGATVLGPPVLRLIEQIGLLPQVEAASKTLSGLTIVDGESRKIGRLEGIDQDRYGYPLRLIARQDLHRILLDHVPKEHIQHGKLVVETLQNPNGASCKCSDGSTYYGDIIVGADGSHSLTRDRMYTHLKEQGKLPDADMEPSCYEHITIGGVTGPLDKTIYPAAHESTAEMHAIYTKDAPYSVSPLPLACNR
jgi:2-polyprenyl-6-methoxyphenol hydroxylase-like FAD-dependent oxidoreductase